MSSISNVMERCRAFDAKREFASSIRILTDAMSEETSSYLLFQRGLRYEEIEEFDNAIKDFNSSISIDQRADAIIARGRVFSRTPSTFGLAEADFTSVLKQFPKDRLARRHLCLLYTIWDRFDDATTVAKSIVNLSQNDASSHHLLGNCYYLNSQFDLAVQEFLIAIELMDSNSEFWLSLGRALRELGRPEDSLVAYEKAVQLERSVSNLVRLASVLLDLGNAKRTIDILKIAMKFPLSEGDWYLVESIRKAAEKMLNSK